MKAQLIIVAPENREKPLDEQSMTDITGREPKTNHLKQPHFDNALISLHQQGKLKSRLAELFK